MNSIHQLNDCRHQLKNNYQAIKLNPLDLDLLMEHVGWLSSTLDQLIVSHINLVEFTSVLVDNYSNIEKEHLHDHQPKGPAPSPD